MGCVGLTSDAVAKVQAHIYNDAVYSHRSYQCDIIGISKHRLSPFIAYFLKYDFSLLVPSFSLLWMCEYDLKLFHVTQSAELSRREIILLLCMYITTIIASAERCLAVRQVSNGSTVSYEYSVRTVQCADAVVFHVHSTVGGLLSPCVGCELVNWLTGRRSSVRVKLILTEY